CAQVIGHGVTVTIGGQHGNFELNTMMPGMARALLESIELLARAVEAFRTKTVEGIEANRDRCRELLERNPSIATALNPYIGYERAAQVAKEAAARGESVRAVLERLGWLPREQLDEVLNVRAMTEPGIVGGGVLGGAG
ncbi:MAG TPA: aspartate ammonia-lyase, partial [Chloroflexota bacterium]